MLKRICAPVLWGVVLALAPAADGRTLWVGAAGDTVAAADFTGLVTGATAADTVRGTGLVVVGPVDLNGASVRCALAVVGSQFDGEFGAAGTGQVRSGRTQGGPTARPSRTSCAPPCQGHTTTCPSSQPVASDAHLWLQLSSVA